MEVACRVSFYTSQISQIGNVFGEIRKCRVSFFTSQISRIGEFFGGNNELVGRVSFILFKFHGRGKFWGQFGSSLQAEFYPSQISRIGDVLGEIRN